MFRLFDIIRRHHHVLTNFIARDLKVKYRGTVFGYLWSLLEPLSLVGIYYFVFVVIANRGGEAYPVIVILGVLPYNLMGSIIQSGASALTGSAPLIRRVYIPREVFVLAAVGSNLVMFFLSLLVVIPFLALYDLPPGPRLVFFPVAVLLLTLFSTGIAFLVACANAVYRDVGYVIRVVLRIMFYGAPIIYTLDMVPERMRDVYLLNPTAVYISLTRNSILNHPFPFDLADAALASAIAVVTFAVGTIAFSRWEKTAVKFL